MDEGTAGNRCSICGAWIPVGCAHVCTTATLRTLCQICGGSVTVGLHGWGLCKSNTETRYLGVTPDQVRQIVREELERFFAGRSSQP